MVNFVCTGQGRGRSDSVVMLACCRGFYRSFHRDEKSPLAIALTIPGVAGSGFTKRVEDSHEPHSSNRMC